MFTQGGWWRYRAVSGGVSDHLKSSFFELLPEGNTSSAPKARIIRPIVRQTN